ncbi:MAG: amidohydrolase family protein [Actinomycetota bacterium]
MSVLVRAPLAWFGPGRLVARAAVVADGDRVTFAGQEADAPEASEVIELDGFLMPAAADRHVHIGLSDPVAVLGRGVTAVRDLGWPADAIFSMSEASQWGTYAGPLIVASGPILTAPAGYPSQDSWAPEGTALEIPEPEDAVWAVEELVSRGAGQIKVALNGEAGPTPSDAVLAAIVATAAEHELPVTVHAQGKGEVERAVGAGVTELAHTPWSHRLSERAIQAMAGSLRVVSTLDMLSFGNDTPQIRVALDNLRRFHDAGGEVVYGTDLGNGAIPPGIHVRELMLMREAGLSNDEIIAGLIRAPIEEGGPADLIGLPESPFSDLSVFDDLLLVMRGGEVAWAVGE